MTILLPAIIGLSLQSFARPGMRPGLYCFFFGVVRPFFGSISWRDSRYSGRPQLASGNKILHVCGTNVCANDYVDFFKKITGLRGRLILCVENYFFVICNHYK